MEMENKETFLRDRYGNYKDWVEFAGVILGIFGLILLMIAVITGLFAIGDYYEVQAFNQIHGSNYSFGEWFWAEGTIKDYHLGKVQNINLDITGGD